MNKHREKIIFVAKLLAVLIALALFLGWMDAKSEEDGRWTWFLILFFGAAWYFHSENEASKRRQADFMANVTYQLECLKGQAAAQQRSLDEIERALSIDTGSRIAAILNRPLE